MEAYKAIKDFHDETVLYITVSYLLGKNEVQSKAALHFPASDLSFLDVESEGEDNEGVASKLEIVVGPSTVADPPPTA